jgi:hypothetical protein
MIIPQIMNGTAKMRRSENGKQEEKGTIMVKRRAYSEEDSINIRKSGSIFITGRNM